MTQGVPLYMLQCPRYASETLKLVIINFPGAHFSGGQFPWGSILRGVIFPGAIFLEKIFRGTFLPGAFFRTLILCKILIVPLLRLQRKKEPEH